MWFIAFFAMVLKFVEVTITIHTRTPDGNGGWFGGAHRYLGSLWKPMGIAWALMYGFAVLMCCGLHTSSVVSATSDFGIPPIATVTVIAVLMAFVTFGGMQGLIKITDFLTPIMGGIYLLGGLIIIVLNIDNLIPALISVFANAFTGTAATGGFVGAVVSETIRNGFKRGLFSNDAGVGSGSILHSQVETKDPVEQGFWGIFEVFCDTIIICSFTALIILVTGVWETGAGGEALARLAYTSVFGEAGRYLANLSLILFAGSSAISMGTMVTLMSKDMFNKVVYRALQVTCVVLCFVGGLASLDAVLGWVDFFNGVAIYIHVVGLLMFSKVIKKLVTSYLANGVSSLEE